LGFGRVFGTRLVVGKEARVVARKEGGDFRELQWHTSGSWEL
jgi:hypothetical protein